MKSIGSLNTFRALATASACLLMLVGCGGGGGSGSAGPTPNPVPSISSIAPAVATAGGAAFTLTVNGTNFIAGSAIQLSGSNRATTFVSATQLTASITAADISSAGTPPVSVENPTPGGGTSTAINLSITNPSPSISSLSPSPVTVGGPAFTLTVTGSNFVAASTVQWNGSNRTTTYVSATQLTASINAADISMTGNVTVAVVTPTPGGGTSSEIGLTLSDPTPTSSS